ncbi:RloB family protein [Chryseobacterium sp. G0201]|uniref:RloB family protein n=1 Tax=Chryseobacterium sp. G0201 TaxID=2487065 RepID=UPI000F4EF8D1|nr:RloB family protein [Chryseobacterium sp. G0201]AZA52097.1 RloB domain-containing protein [Chryseobacterium sp. G0201]
MKANKRILREIKIAYAIVGDGGCEVWFFQMLKRIEREIQINIEPKLAQKSTLAKQFEKIKELAEDYNRVFWIVDYDVIERESKECKKGDKPRSQEFKEYYEYIQKKLSEKVIVIVNNTCLEFWFLLHFNFTSKNFSNCDEAQKELKKYLKDYEKSQTYFTKQKDIYSQLKDKIPTAIANAKKLGEFDIQNPNKSMAEMWKFFEDENIKFIIK